MKRTNGVLEGNFHEFRLTISEAIRGGQCQGIFRILISITGCWAHADIQVTDDGSHANIY